MMKLIKSPSTTLFIDIALYFTALVVAVLLILHNKANYLADDGGFFLKYAENIAHGFGWRFNASDPPIWGASAPFWPAIIAIPMLFGVSAFHSVVAVGIAMTLSAFMIVVYTLRKNFSVFSALFFIAIGLSNQWVSYHATSGLESPFSILLIALGFYSLTARNLKPWAYVLIGFFLINNKIDYIPLGVAYCFALFFYEHTKSQAVRICLCVMGLTLMWVLFTYIHFGTILPNSFARKFMLVSDDAIRITVKHWFVNEVFVYCGQQFISAFVLVGLVYLGIKRLPLFFFLGSISAHLIGYSLFPPIEPFTWYLTPSIFTYAILAAISLAVIPSYIMKSPKLYIKAIAGIVIVAASVAAYDADEIALSGKLKYYVDLYEADRSEAGMWIDKNLPKDYKIDGYFGNVDYWSNRYIYDGTYLNRNMAADQYFLKEKQNIRQHFRPEVEVPCGGSDGQPVIKVVNDLTKDEYKAVKYFGKTKDAGMDFFCIVMVRKDLPIEPDKDDLKYFKE